MCDFFYFLSVFLSLFLCLFFLHLEMIVTNTLDVSKYTTWKNVHVHDSCLTIILGEIWDRFLFLQYFFFLLQYFLFLLDAILFSWCNIRGRREGGGKEEKCSILYHEGKSVTLKFYVTIKMLSKMLFKMLSKILFKMFWVIAHKKSIDTLKYLFDTFDTFFFLLWYILLLLHFLRLSCFVFSHHDDQIIFEYISLYLYAFHASYCSWIFEHKKMREKEKINRERKKEKGEKEVMCSCRKKVGLAHHLHHA